MIASINKEKIPTKKKVVEGAKRAKMMVRDTKI